MSRQVIKFSALAAVALWATTGCHPQQPFYFFEDGDLSHYMDVATERKEPDLCQPSIDEVVGAREPLTLENAENYEIWELSLEEAIHHTLNNSQVMRGLGGRVSGRGPINLANFQGFGAQNIVTTFDPAIVESGTGFNTGSPLSVNGVESALAAFDAQWNSSIVWEKNDRPQNFRNNQIFPPVFDQDTARFTSGITKTSASGGTVSFRNNTVYDQNNSPLRALISDYTTNFEAEIRQPLLQGAGTQFNRIAGPGNGFLQNIDGVMIARIRADMTLADFESGVRNLLEETETAYYELYFAYRNLDARKIGRDSALQAWKKVNNLKNIGGVGGEAEKEAQARTQYFLFRSEVENALTGVYTAEGRLRYLMGLAMADGRLIRPSDEPSNARMTFDWCSIHPEALARRCELRKQKWEVKKRELELIAARNFLLPRLDATARYRWLGLGDDLINSEHSGLQPLQTGSSAFESLTDGGFQEWQLGLNLNVPIGFRRELTGVRHHQLLLARERAVLRDMELEVSHQLGEAVRSLVNNYSLTQTNFNRRVAAEREVDAVNSAYESGKTTLDLLLDAQRRRADAEVAYYRSLTDYNLAIMQIHRTKDSLLEYNGVYLAEGPWPKKAYFDALREARKRDASMYLDYGFTRPRVVSRGPVDGQMEGGMHEHGEGYEEGGMYEQQMPTEAEPEEIPAPKLEPTPAEPLRSTGKGLRISEPTGPLLQGPQLSTTRSTAPRETTAAEGRTTTGPALRSQPTSLKLSQPTGISSGSAAAAAPAKKSSVVRLNFEEFSKKTPNAPAAR